MTYYSIDIFSKTLKQTKDFLWPIKFVTWLKLALLTLLGGSAAHSTSFSFNFNMRGNPDQWSEMLGSASQFFVDYWHYMLMGYLLLVGIGLLWRFIQSLFIFSFIESVHREKVQIMKWLSRNYNLAISYFLFMLVFTLISTGLFLLITLPLLFPLVKAGTFSFALINKAYFVFAIIALVFMTVISRILNSLQHRIIIYHMYFKRVSVLKAWKQLLSILWKELLQIILFWLILLAVAIGVGIIIFIIVLLLMFVLGLLGLIVGGILWIIWLATKSLAVILIISIPIGLIFLLFFIAAIIFLSVPLMVFYIKYSLNFVQEMYKKNKKFRSARS